MIVYQMGRKEGGHGCELDLEQGDFEEIASAVVQCPEPFTPFGIKVIEGHFREGGIILSILQP